MLIRTATFAIALLLGFAANIPDANACGKCKPPEPVKKIRVNSGVGNGPEGGTTEATDKDPGRSGFHNQAGKNSAKPNSPRATTSVP